MPETSASGEEAPTEEPTAGAPAGPEVLATGLHVPWDLAFLPDGSTLVTLRERAEVLQIRPGEEPVRLGTVPDVAPGGEGGLLGAAISPGFADDAAVFFYLTTAEDNRVVRMRLADGGLTPEGPVLTGIPHATNHNGGRIAFGPDGYLYVATGDAGTPGLSQDPGSLGGKILRIEPDGDPAPGNPEPGSPVWSSGHRNVQGMGWDAEGRMFASEFGQNTWDELNLIEAGGNYGWPEVEGAAGVEGYADPLHQWRPADASPSGLAVGEDAIYLAALRGESLWRIPLTGGATGEPERLLAGEYGRLRHVAVGDAGDLWVLTNNTSRGDPGPEDDRLVVLDPDRLD